MCPAMLNLQVSGLKNLGKNPKPIILMIVYNWLVAPFVGLLMTRLFLQNYKQHFFWIRCVYSCFKQVVKFTKKFTTQNQSIT